jgi:hemolysin activation/secretion protein
MVKNLPARFKKGALFLWLSSMALWTGQAQNYEAVAPKAVPQDTVAPKLPSDIPVVKGDDTLILKKLKAVVFVDSMKEVQAGSVEASGVVPSANELTKQPEFLRLVEPYIGGALSMKSLNTLVRDLVVHFRKHDRPVVDVVVPEQDVTNGVLQIAIVEGRVDSIKAEGNRWYSSEWIEGQIRLRPGDTIRASKLLSDLSWLNQNPFRSVDAVFAPSKDLGETDIILRTKDRFPLRPYVGYQDSGNDQTGYERWYAGFNWANPWDGQLSYQFTTSSDIESVVANSVSYLQPLPWRHTVMVYAAFVDSQAEIPSFNLSGSSTQAGIRYGIPLPPAGAYQHEAYTGFDWKQSDNLLEFGVPITASTTDIGEMVFGYRSSLADPWGITQFQVEGFYNPAGLFDNQTDAAYGASRLDADPHFGYVNIDLNRLTKLPWNFSFNNHLKLQWAVTNLLASEQLGMGGYYSVRGYDDYDVTGTDEGWVLQNELRTPPISLLKSLKLSSKFEDQLQFLFFFDVGQARSDSGQIVLNNGNAVDKVTMAGIGPGIRYAVNPYLSVRADYGFQLYDTGDEKASRWHIEIMLAY